MRDGEMRWMAVLLTALLIIVFTGPSVFAGPPVKQAPAAKAVTDVRARDLKLSADVSVSYIEYFNCPCEINMDVYYVKDYLSVKIFNDSTLKPAVKVTAEYFDIPSNRVKKVTKNHTFTGRGGKKVIMLNQPMLIKKSYGVKAKVEITGTKISDPNPANNNKTQLLCGQVPE